MRKRDITITAALCASLVAHWGLVYSLTENEIRVLERQTHLGPIDLVALFGKRERGTPAPTDPPELPKPQLARIELPQPEPMTYEDVFGEHGGKGKSINSATGDQPMQAQHAEEDQSFLNHNPNADITRTGAATPPGSSAGGGGKAGNAGGGQDGNNGSALLGDGSVPPPIGASPLVAIKAITPRELENTPFGVPPAPPPSQLPPSALSKRLPAIAIDAPREKLLPTTQRVEEHPLNATTQSAITREASPATRPIDIDPTTRPSQANVAFITPSTQQAVDPSTTQPSQIALQELKLTGPKGILPTTQEALANLPTTLPATQPTKLVAIALASTGESAAPPDVVPPPLTVPPPQPPPTTPPQPPTPTPAAAGSPGSAGARGNPGMPGAPGTSGGPAGSEGGNKSESESDPFSSADSQNFAYVNGRVDAHDGRKVKTVRPHIGEAARRDLMSMESPRVDLILRIDETGKVRDVQIVPGRSSGSEVVDLSAIRAAFEWEFEPPLDKSGRPRPDVQVIPFVWH